MKKTIIRLIAVVVLLVLAMMAYFKLTEPEIATPPPVPVPTAPAETGASGSSDENNTEASVPEEGTEDVVTTQSSDVQATLDGKSILVIEVAGSTEGIIEIELATDLAPNHAARIMALAEAGKYDNIVFHRVIEGFMAQTGDVQYGVLGSDDLVRAGSGASSEPDLAAEFSDAKFATGVVGMARSSSPDSANSQFFIMFDEAPYLNGQYTVVGRVIAGQDVVNSIKKGSASQNGAVQDPDYMKNVRMK